MCPIVLVRILSALMCRFLGCMISYAFVDGLESNLHNQFGMIKIVTLS